MALIYRLPKYDWRALAKAVYDGWCKGEDVAGPMHELGAALKEAPDCEARHYTRPDARCSRVKGHDGNHRWTRSNECPHSTIRLHGATPVCTACGIYMHDSPNEGDGSQERP